MKTKDTLRFVIVVAALVAAPLMLRALRGTAREMTMARSQVEQPGRAADDRHIETATFGAGCFWGVEAAFRKVEGVVETAVGYSGGHYDNPTYSDVCTGRTGHAEVVRVRFDPEKVSYEALLEVFWRAHDPTQLNRQGPDVGSQYRSVIFYHSPEQQAAAQASKEAIDESRRHPRPIVTSIEPARTFWRAEEYHQQYLEKRGAASCHGGLL